jgi:hypothetical protein
VPISGPQAHPPDRHRHCGPRPPPRGVGRGVDLATLNTGRVGRHPFQMLVQGTYSNRFLFVAVGACG